MHTESKTAVIVNYCYRYHCHAGGSSGRIHRPPVVGYISKMNCLVILFFALISRTQCTVIPISLRHQSARQDWQTMVNPAFPDFLNWLSAKVCSGPRHWANSPRVPRGPNTTFRSSRPEPAIWLGLDLLRRPVRVGIGRDSKLQFLLEPSVG